MFFARDDFPSVNKVTELRNGRYRKSILEYQNSSGTAAVLIYEYRFEDELQPSVVDVIFIDKSNVVRSADYVQIPSGQWRASNGQVGPSLLSLLPQELDSFRLLGETKSNNISVENGQFTIL